MGGSSGSTDDAGQLDLNARNNAASHAGPRAGGRSCGGVDRCQASLWRRFVAARRGSLGEPIGAASSTISGWCRTALSSQRQGQFRSLPVHCAWDARTPHAGDS
eukprot:scaffold4278_cov346-Prasinococcus_capsulatus_cf.AAC.3